MRLKNVYTNKSGHLCIRTSQKLQKVSVKNPTVLYISRIFHLNSCLGMAFSTVYASVPTVNGEHPFRGTVEIVQHRQSLKRLPDSRYPMKHVPDYQHWWECQYWRTCYFQTEWIYKNPLSSHDLFKSVLEDLRISNNDILSRFQYPETREKIRKEKNIFYIFIKA